jgi:hypothetical protein
MWHNIHHILYIVMDETMKFTTHMYGFTMTFLFLFLVREITFSCFVNVFKKVEKCDF